MQLVRDALVRIEAEDPLVRSLFRGKLLLGRESRPLSFNHAGATFSLSEGQHTLETSEKTERLRLLWGRDVKMPAIEPSQQPIFAGF